MRTAFAVLAALLLPAAAHSAERPPMPTTSAIPGQCVWEWVEFSGLGLWAEKCNANGVYQVVARTDPPQFVLMVDGEPVATVVQAFDKPADADISAILPALRSYGYIPDDDECVFAPASEATLMTIGPRPRTFAFYEIVPTGARLAAVEATPADEVPEPQCGDYGSSASGTRFFQTDTRHPGKVVYVDLGQDGTMIDPATITLE